MAPIDQKQRAERRVLQLLKDAGLPTPDAIKYGADSVRFEWQDQKVALVVELEDFDEIDFDGGYDYEDIAA
jgi:hypothetical protein